jgi:hypothetical protein
MPVEAARLVAAAGHKNRRYRDVGPPQARYGLVGHAPGHCGPGLLDDGIGPCGQFARIGYDKFSYG